MSCFQMESRKWLTRLEFGICPRRKPVETGKWLNRFRFAGSRLIYLMKKGRWVLCHEKAFAKMICVFLSFKELHNVRSF